jgi:hypothetical protein
VTTPQDRDRLYAEQAEAFARLRERVERVLARFGRPLQVAEHLDGDYTVRATYSGFRKVAVVVCNLEMLRPAVVTKLRGLLNKFPDWGISIAVAPRGRQPVRPDMGLHVTRHGVQDGLQREHLPKEFQDIEHEDSDRDGDLQRVSRHRGPRAPLRQGPGTEGLDLSWELWVFSHQRLGSIAEWQAAVDAEGFPLQLSAETPFERLNGFVPSRLRGEETGFEVYHDDAGELICGNSHVDFKQEWKYVLALRSIHLTEAATQAIWAAAAAYARVTGGVVFHDYSGEFFTASEALDVVRYREDLDRRYHAEAEVFERLYERARDLLRHYGRPNFLPEQPQGDYTVHGDYGGCPEIVVFASSLEMLRPPVVQALQNLVREFPGWQVTVTVAVRGRYDGWPNMGLYIRPFEIVDGLQRQLFPKEFQDLDFGGLEGVRRGNMFD